MWPAFAPKRQRESHSVEWFLGRTAHLAACSPNRNLPFALASYVNNATERVLFRAGGKICGANDPGVVNA